MKTFIHNYRIHIGASIIALVLLFGGAELSSPQTTTDVVTPLNQAQASITSALAAAQAQSTLITSQQTQIASLQAQLAATPITTATPPPIVGSQGVVNYYELMNSIWDTFTKTPTAAQEAQIKASINTIATYSPYWDSRLSWFANAEVYVDGTSVYTNDPVITQHPEYIAHDTQGRMLYLNWNCSGGICPQYLMDITNANARAWKTAGLQSAVAPGYTGVFLDDVNMHITGTDGSGNIVAPKDPATGTAMTLPAWKTYMVALLKQYRAAIPGKHITHNSVWFDGSPTSDALILQQMQLADRVNVERGFGDTGITGGTGGSSLGAYMTWMNDVHQTAKKPVNIMDYYPANQRYSLAAYFLIQEAGDSFGIANETLANWDANHLYGVNLGAAKTYHFWNAQGFWERDFANGKVFVNEPGAPARTLTVPVGLHYIGGVAAPATITLGASDAVILVNN